MMNDLGELFGRRMPSPSEVGEQGNPPNNDLRSGIQRLVESTMNEDESWNDVKRWRNLMNDSGD